MTLSHFSRTPIERVVMTDPPGPGFEWAGKPTGLWVSVDGEDDWPTWCRENEFGCGDFRYRVHLAESDRVLRLETEAEVLAFSRRYETPSYTEHLPVVDWRAVQSDHAAIIIAPYQWGLRLDTDAHWYYGWDCASGCVWDPSVVDHIELLSGPSQEARVST